MEPGAIAAKRRGDWLRAKVDQCAAEVKALETTRAAVLKLLKSREM